MLLMINIIQTCRVTGRKFTVNEWEQELLKKFGAPPPTLCIDERHRRRLAHRNERKIYNDVCDLTGEKLISIYSPDKPFKVYSAKAWWGDAWEPRDYGRDFDFERPFFEQWKELMMEVPRVAQDFYPMTREEVLAKGWEWLDEEQREIGSGPKIADSIEDVSDDVCGKDIATSYSPERPERVYCEQCYLAEVY